MRYSKISLINPLWCTGEIKYSDSGFHSPLSLFSLVSFIKQSDYKGDIQLLDQNVLTRSEFIDRLIQFQPELVGFSPTVNSYQQSLSMATMMKKIYQADTVFTGGYATELADNILHNSGYIDYVIKDNDEFALKELAEGEELKIIYNLSYRKSDGITNNPIITYAKTSQTDFTPTILETSGCMTSASLSTHRQHEAKEHGVAESCIESF